MIKIGDKVRFLNAVGGGVVRRIDRDIVFVEEEDGFETPILARECVVIEEGRVQDKGVPPVGKDEEPRRHGGSPKQPAAPQPDDDEDEEMKFPVEETREGERLSLYLAFVPEDTARLDKTTFDAYLINDSNYYLDYICLSRCDDGGWQLRSRGTAEPNIQVCLETFDRETVGEWEHLSVQAVAYKRGKNFECKEPVSVSLHIDPVKFYKLHTFGTSEFFDEMAWVLPLVERDLPMKSLHIDAQVLARAMHEKHDDAPVRRPEPRKQPRNEIVEVDLHIHELVDTTAGMSNGDMLQLQLQTFRDTLEQHKGEKGRKIVFIHGKGDGVLRRAILDELQRRYKHYDYQDASFREYGFGATQVTIR